MIRILYFARLRETLGVAEEFLAWDPSWRSVADLGAALAARGGTWGAAFAPGPTLLCAVNQTLARPETPLGDGDEVAFFPPVTGG
jgi:molybdopterin synthase sulfur carrier subunit